jgi:hypothetical protein
MTCENIVKPLSLKFMLTSPTLLITVILTVLQCL